MPRPRQRHPSTGASYTLNMPASNFRAASGGATAFDLQDRGGNVEKILMKRRLSMTVGLGFLRSTGTLYEVESKDEHKKDHQS